jgi:hypothetical protein
MSRFGKAKVTVTLTGEEWFALLARITRRELSPKGSRVYRQAADKICAQIGAASDIHAQAKEVQH